MSRIQEVATKAKAGIAAAAEELSSAISKLSLVGISAAILTAIALVGVTTDGLPVVVRNQPFAFATGIAVCVFIVAVSTVSNIEGRSLAKWVVRLSGILLAGALASTVYMAAWGATEATAARITVTFSGEETSLRYQATVTATLLPSDDMLTVFATTGSREELSSCGRLMPELADQQPRRGVEIEDGKVLARQASDDDDDASADYEGEWVTIARVGPDAGGTAVWSGTGTAEEGVEALCIKAVVPERCAMGLKTDEGLCRIGSEAKETFWLIDLGTAATITQTEDGGQVSE